MRPFDLQSALARCTVTGQIDNCVRLFLCEIPDQSGMPVAVYATFSDAGLAELRDRLATLPKAVVPAPAHDLRALHAYQWAVVFRDGEQLQQYPLEGDEVPLAAVRFDRVAELWWVSRWAEGERLPWFGLVPGRGFVRSEWTADGERVETVLRVPAPVDGFQWNIYRRVTRQIFVAEEGGGWSEEAPPHVRFVLGWQVGDVQRVAQLDPEGRPTDRWTWEGDGLLCEIAVEDQGDWQVYQQEELGTHRF